MVTLVQSVTETMIHLHVLGDPQVTRDGASVALQRKPLAVLTYLALAAPGRFIQRDTLLGVFWSELEQSKARAALRQALHYLRHELGEELLLTEGDESVALAHELLECDAIAFERAIAEGQLRAAVDLYHGPVLRGLHVRGCPEFDHWLDGERAPRERAFSAAIERLAETARSQGHHRQAADWLRRLARIDPLSGRVIARLMTELEAAGSREEALRVGEGHVVELKREWDAAPDPQVQALLDRLRAAPVAVSNPSLGSALPLRCEIGMVREAFADRYDVLRELGGGTLGKVFLAWDRALRRHVALKVLKPELRQTVNADRFLQEIELVAQFNHPHIVPLFEAGEIGGFVHYTMRHVPGASLGERVQRDGHLPIGEAMALAREVAQALHYAHERKVVHRDVTTRNVLVLEGSAVLADFGTAIVLEVGGKRLTESGVWLGTPEYMSPEQSQPGGLVDRRADVYGLGCVLYHVLAGEPVYSGANWSAVISKHQRERIPSVRIVRPEVPEVLEAILVRALQKAPADRFATAGEFAAALEGP